MSKVRVYNFSIPLDGFGACLGQGHDHPLGVGGARLHQWVFATRSGRRTFREGDSDTGVDEAFLVQGNGSAGATIMGRHMFAPIHEPWGEDNWTG